LRLQTQSQIQEQKNSSGQGNPTSGNRTPGAGSGNLTPGSVGIPAPGSGANPTPGSGGNPEPGSGGGRGSGGKKP